MKILTNKKYDELTQAKKDKEELEDAIQYLLRRFALLNLDEPIESIDNNYSFWTAIGYLKSAAEHTGMKSDGGWIEP